MTEADKIEELAKWFEILDNWCASNISYAKHQEHARFLRSLSTRLKDLEEAKEALEWLINDMPRDDIEMLVGESFDALPLFLQKLWGDKK